MAKKNVATKKKKVVELTKEEKEEVKMEGELPKKLTREKENMQLIWFLLSLGLFLL